MADLASVITREPSFGETRHFVPGERFLWVTRHRALTAYRTIKLGAYAGGPESRSVRGGGGNARVP